MQRVSAAFWTGPGSLVTSESCGNKARFRESHQRCGGRNRNGALRSPLPGHSGHATHSQNPDHPTVAQGTPSPGCPGAEHEQPQKAALRLLALQSPPVTCPRGKLQWEPDCPSGPFQTARIRPLAALSWHLDQKSWHAPGLQEGPSGGTPCPACKLAGLAPPWQSGGRAPGSAGSPYLAVHSRADGKSCVPWDWDRNSLQHLQDVSEALQENGVGRGG